MKKNAVHNGAIHVSIASIDTCTLYVRAYGLAAPLAARAFALIKRTRTSERKCHVGRFIPSHAIEVPPSQATCSSFHLVRITPVNSALSKSRGADARAVPCTYRTWVGKVRLLSWC